MHMHLQENLELLCMLLPKALKVRAIKDTMHMALVVHVDSISDTIL